MEWQTLVCPPRLKKKIPLPALARQGDFSFHLNFNKTRLKPFAAFEKQDVML